jgi:lipoprotein-anchoring transpeptidase ErfK/SrfK
MVLLVRCAHLSLVALVVVAGATGVAAQSYPPGYYGPPPWDSGSMRYVRPFREYDDRDRYYAPRGWREPPRASPYQPPVAGWRYPGDSPERDYRAAPRPPVPATPIHPYERRHASAEPPSANLRDGGPQPHINPIRPQPVPYRGGHAAGTIVIETKARHLLLITSNGSALRYPISVGREGFQWTGTEKISRIADWPDWHPPAEMRKRDPGLPEKMTGGIRNPLGAKALYLGSTLYRIHGTNDASTVGYASSSGCFRMLNGHVVDLASRVGVGTMVVVK